MWGRSLNSAFCTWITQLSQHNLSPLRSSLHGVAWAPLSEAVVPKCPGWFLDSQFYSMGIYVCFMPVPHSLTVLSCCFSWYFCDVKYLFKCLVSIGLPDIFMSLKEFLVYSGYELFVGYIRVADTFCHDSLSFVLAILVSWFQWPVNGWMRHLFGSLSPVQINYFLKCLFNLWAHLSNGL